ncbi:MAG: sulfur carrier protein ThiS [Chthoniobacterales bacterium]
MQLKINGNSQEFSLNTDIPELLKKLSLPPETVLIEHNQTALLRSEWTEVKLQDGDSIEILRVAAGG